ncbi:AI-2E family transporter [Anatilimnocola floriformis]|uniref:AI-2E family transporter n=1 Tax=Anatilimnocola floriformis TaxID=2948575 RepID=UPI0020C554CD|nr:AI-2E family transporter [Anatilimnocola floriformis]
MTQLTLAKHLAAIALTLLALLALWTAGSAVAIFMASLAVAAALHPQVEYFRERGWPSWAAAGVVASGCLLVLCVLLIMLAPSLVANLRSLEQDISLAATSFAEASPDHWFVRMTSPVAEISEEIKEEIKQTPAGESPAAKLGQMLLTPLIGTAAGLVQLSALGGICFALAFYWTLDRERFERLWLSLVPVRRRVGAQRMWQSIEREVGAYLRSEILQFLLAVVLLWAVFSVLDLRYAALAAVVAGSLTLIPWLGTIFGSAVVMILTSPKLADWNGPWASSQTWAALAAIVLVLCLLEFVIEPKLFQRDRYNPLWTALVAIVMAATWGIWGLLFGPLAGYVLQILVRQVYPRLVQVQPRIASEASLQERLKQLESRFSEQAEVTPELVSLKKRLTDLVTKRAEVGVSATG